MQKGHSVPKSRMGEAHARPCHSQIVKNVNSTPYPVNAQAPDHVVDGMFHSNESESSMTHTAILSIWPDDERDRKR